MVVPAFILHYAHVCAAAGGIDAFLIGSEMVAMTQIRGPGNTYPAVAALRRLAADVRGILGPNVKIGYASDWSEYFGHHPGNGELFFHLDPLWLIRTSISSASTTICRCPTGAMATTIWMRPGVGSTISTICAPMSREERGYDWFYASDADRLAQNRTPITDGAYDEAWVWRYKT